MIAPVVDTDRYVAEAVVGKEAHMDCVVGVVGTGYY
jgi:hypothetical protein